MPFRLIICYLLCLSSFQGYCQSHILFSRADGKLNTGGTLDILIYDPLKSETKLIMKGTIRKRGEHNPITSPDGKKIVFNTYRYSGWKLAIGEFNDHKITNIRRLTSRSNYEYSAKFSPDGSKIVYQEYNWSSNGSGIFVADREGKNVTTVVESKGVNKTPDWTRDNQAIVYASASGDNFNIYLKNLKTAEYTELTNTSFHEFAPSTSKTENKIAFLGDNEGSINLYVIDMDGGNLKKLTNNFKSDAFDKDGFWAYSTCWSPDGKQIVFNAMIEGNLEIFTVNSDGTGLKQITDNDDSDINPFWMF